MQNILEGTRVYLSGPMDFVGNRLIEKYLGWRAILTPILKALDITVLDPWNKPLIRGHKNYGQEGVEHYSINYDDDFWTNDETRARFETDFWETVHIDLRMTDIADFLIAFVPTNIYSVGTVHEIVVARGQHKPTLMVSPPIKYEFFPEIDELSEAAKKALKFYGLKENPNGIPSQWYGNVIGGNNMFNGFGWEGIEFKSKSFYPTLLKTVIENAKPAETSGETYSKWANVKKWVNECQPLQDLQKGVIDYLEFDEGEKELLDKALDNKQEQNRKFFWYNKPYSAQRSVLYQLFSIASGYIPPKLSVIPDLDENGQMTYRTHQSKDDSWLLISPRL